MHTFKSGVIFGVGEDAAHIAEHHCDADLTYGQGVKP